MTDLTLNADEERAIRQALMDLPKECQYHGSDFEKLGMWRTMPRCESCRIPFRAKVAWQAFTAALDRRDDLPRRVPAPEAETQLLDAKREAVREARAVIGRYLATAEKWRYDRAMWAFAIMLGEIPEDTPEPLSPADEEELKKRAGNLNSADGDLFPGRAREWE